MVSLWCLGDVNRIIGPHVSAWVANAILVVVGFDLETVVISDGGYNIRKKRQPNPASQKNTSFQTNSKSIIEASLASFTSSTRISKVRVTNISRLFSVARVTSKVVAVRNPANCSSYGVGALWARNAHGENCFSWKQYLVYGFPFVLAILSSPLLLQLVADVG